MKTKTADKIIQEVWESTRQRRLVRAKDTARLLKAVLAKRKEIYEAVYPT